MRSGRREEIAAALAFALWTLPASGTSPEPLRVGMTTALSGPAQDLGRGMRLGVEAAFGRANRTGGIGDRTLELIVLDDGYVPAAARENMLTLAAREDILAVLGNVGTPTAKETVPIAKQERLLLFGAFTGAGLLRTPPSRYVVNYRASYAEETRAMVEGLLAHGIRPYEIAFFTQDDSYGDAGYEGAVAALEQNGYEAARSLPHGRYKRNTLNVEPGLFTLLKARPEPRAIIMVGAYGPCAKLIRLARRALRQPLFLNVSFVGSRALAAALGEDGAATAEDVIVTQVVPHPAAGLRIAEEYRKDLARHAPGTQPDFVSFEGYVVGRLFTRALRSFPSSKATWSRETVVAAVEGLGRINLGGIEVHLAPGDYQASHVVWLTLLRRDGVFGQVEWSELPSGSIESNDGQREDGDQADRPE